MHAVDLTIRTEEKPVFDFGEWESFAIGQYHTILSGAGHRVVWQQAVAKQKKQLVGAEFFKRIVDLARNRLA